MLIFIVEEVCSLCTRSHYWSHCMAKFFHQEVWNSDLSLGLGLGSLALGSGFGLRLDIRLGLGLGLELSLRFSSGTFAIAPLLPMHLLPSWSVDCSLQFEQFRLNFSLVCARCWYAFVRMVSLFLSLPVGAGGGVTTPIHSRNSQRRRGSMLNSPPSQMSLLAWSWAGQWSTMCSAVSSLPLQCF